MDPSENVVMESNLLQDENKCDVVVPLLSRCDRSVEKVPSANNLWPSEDILFNFE